MDECFPAWVITLSFRFPLMLLVGDRKCIHCIKTYAACSQRFCLRTRRGRKGNHLSVVSETD